MKTQQQVDDLVKELAELLKKHKVLLQPTINFPKHKKVPLLSRLALKVIGKQGGVCDLKIIDA